MMKILLGALIKMTKKVYNLYESRSNYFPKQK